MTIYRFTEWDKLDGLVRRSVVARSEAGEELLGVTHALRGGRWIQRPADLIYECTTVSREVAQSRVPGVDLDGPVEGYEAGYLPGDVERDALARGIWDVFAVATDERRELTHDEAALVADLMDASRRRFEAAWKKSLG